MILSFSRPTYMWEPSCMHNGKQVVGSVTCAKWRGYLVGLHAPNLNLRIVVEHTGLCFRLSIFCEEHGLRARSLNTSLTELAP